MKTKTRSLLKHKRGEDMLVDFWAILIFAIIVLLFFIIFSINKSGVQKNIEAEFANKDADYMLDSFLRAPLVDNSSRTVSDIIVEDSTTGNFDRTNKLFLEYFKRTNTINSQEINNMIFRIEGDHTDTYGITAEKGRGWFSKSATVTWELTKAFFVNTISSVGSQVPVITLVPKTTDSYVAETYLPGYGKRIYVRVAIVSWTK
jgi:hypothetical protein